MARKQTTSSQKRKSRDEQDEPEVSLASLRRETKHGITAVVLCAFGILAILSFLQLADVVGEAIDASLVALFGWGKYVVPVFFFVLAWMFWKGEGSQMRASNWIGFSLFVLTYSGLFHLIIPEVDSIQAIADGRGGGYLGLSLSYPLRQIAGPWATGVLLVGGVLISVLLWFDTSLPELAGKGNIFSRLAFRYRRFQERMRRNWTMRTLEDGEQQPVDAGEEITDEETEEMPDEVAGAISETEERMKEKARAIAQSPTQRPLLRKRVQMKAVPIDLLVSGGEKPTSGDIEANQETIRATLETFGIPVEMATVNVGPTVTQYTLRPSEGVKLAQIITLANDLALALAAHPIRIEAPIPGKSLVGIEVPNQTKAVVKLRDVLDTTIFKKRESNLSFALGKDVAGTPVIAALDRMPHLLIAGATGSGKSVCINSLLLSLLYSNSPDTLRLILVDPKRVELTPYNNLPHLLTPVITTVDKTINALRWVTVEMDRRFQLLEKSGKRNIHAYNEAHADEHLPFIVVIIDELADLMAVAASEVEGVIIRLAQMARAVGIHLVVATQRPSVDVITGLIKANITSRIAFSVASNADSRTILDTGGAEKLLGRGDLLLMSADLSKPRRLQGTFVTDEEIEAVTRFVRQQGEPEYESSIVEKQQGGANGDEISGDPNEDELFEEAKAVVLQAGKASASYLQRRLRIGYARAARLLDLLEDQGIIGPGDGAKAREVYAQLDTPQPGVSEMTLSSTENTEADASDPESVEDEEPPFVAEEDTEENNEDDKRTV